jgi:deoxyribodipyrimidine photo-lyase
MPIHRIERTRGRALNDRPERPQQGSYVLYWMQASQRADDNHALEYAIARANAFEQSVLVGFGLMHDYPEANLRHYQFMLEGLRDTAEQLKTRGIKLVLRIGSPAEVALALGKRASLIVTDRGYLRHQKAWRREVAEQAECRVVQVETDVVVPVDVVSDKREFAARTIRPKIHRHFREYLSAVPATNPEKSSLPLHETGLDLDDPAALCAKLKLDRSVGAVSGLFTGGPTEAAKRFHHFCGKRLDQYADHRNQPQTDDVSHMAMYLHFGQISPIRLLLEAKEHASGRSENLQSFIEELLVRRELSMNFTEFTDNYDEYACLPEWARNTLDEHRADRRAPRYTPEQLEAAETHDPYWNASMREMRFTGYMHNYMRMYWGKKILEWMESPEEAFATALAMNNKYFLDGRDPNSFTGVAWVFGNHDRPWQEREIYGKIRCMMATGLERKCDIRAYVAKVDRLVERMNSAA